MLTLCFAGLPSAGKSTMINAFAGARVLESGVCRTTTAVCLVGATNAIGAQKWVPTKLESDDGVEFCAVDLPGICDAEDAARSFNKVTREWATKCDAVVWVTDARTAFLTTHEASEYAALRAAMQEKADEDGTLYQLCVVLAKYDASVGTRAPPSGTFLEGEIRTDTEDTTIEACFARVARMFPDTRVVKFSAFARIATCGSDALRALVSASSASTSGPNGKLDLKWATDNLVEKRFAQMSRVLRATRNYAMRAEQRAVSAEHRAVSAEQRAVSTEKDLSAVKKRLDEADARVDKMLGALKRVESHVPVYDKPAELAIEREGSGRRVFSLPMMMLGGTVEVVASIGGVRLPKGPLRSPACAYFEVGTCDRATKTGERVVRPEHGDVFVAPVSALLSWRREQRYPEATEHHERHELRKPALSRDARAGRAAQHEPRDRYERTVGRKGERGARAAVGSYGGARRVRHHGHRAREGKTPAVGALASLRHLLADLVFL
jgi:hypothetical protein